MLVILSAAFMLVDLSIAVVKLKVTVSVAVMMQLEVSAILMQVKVYAANMWVRHFLLILCRWESLLQSCRWVHYADYFYCNYMEVAVSIVGMYMWQLQVVTLYSFLYLKSIFHKTDEKTFNGSYIKFAFHHFRKCSYKIKILCGQNLYTNRLKESHFPRCNTVKRGNFDRSKLLRYRFRSVFSLLVRLWKLTTDVSASVFICI